jgi:hypothetical protein
LGPKQSRTLFHIIAGSYLTARSEQGPLRHLMHNSRADGVRRPLHVRKPFALLLTAAAALGGWRLLLLLWPTAFRPLRLLLLLWPAALGGWRLLLLLWPTAFRPLRLLLLLWPTSLRPLRLLLLLWPAALGGLRWLLLLRPAPLGRWRLLLLLRPTALGGLRWLLRLRPAALGGWRLLLLRPAPLGGWRLIGSPALHSRLTRLIRLLLTLLTLLLLLIAAGWSLTGRRFPSALTRSAWRIVTEPTPLTGGERLCWRHILAWLNDVLRFTHRYLSALSSSLSKILWPYFHRTLNLRGSRQDARPHLKRAEWSSNCCCDNRWSNPWVDGDRGATLTPYDRLVHHNSLVDENVLLARRQNDAHETGCDEIAGPHENPHIGLVAIFDHDLVPEPRNAFNYR